MFTNKVIALLMIMFSTSAFSAGLIEVKKVRGEVTVLMAREHVAKKVFEGQKIPEDSSVLTHEKSFVMLEYANKSKVTVGPNSKMVLEHIKDAKAPGVIQLLKGSIRAKVTKEAHLPENETFLIRTTQASFGVRGTEFQVSLSDIDQETSSILTYEGKVAIRKNDAVAPKNEIVSEGQFSKVSAVEESPIKPITIDKQQFTILAKNTDMQDVVKSNEDVVSVHETNEPVVDMKTGIIIASDNVKIDNTTGAIIDQKLEEEKAKEIKKHENNKEKEAVEVKREVFVMPKIHKDLDNELAVKYGRTYADYKNQGVKYQFKSSDLTVTYTRRIHNLRFLKLEVLKNMDTELSGIKNGPSQKNGAEYKEKLLPSLTYIEKLALGSGLMALEAGAKTYNYFYEDGLYIRNKVKVHPKIGVSYENNIKEVIDYSIGLNTLYSVGDSFGMGAQAGLKKTFDNDLSLSTLWSHDVMNDNNQRNTTLTIGMGYDF